MGCEIIIMLQSNTLQSCSLNNIDFIDVGALNVDPN